VGLETILGYLGQMTTTTGRRLLRVRETAELLGMHPETLRRSIAAGTSPLEPIRFRPRGGIYFRAGDVAELVGASEPKEAR
jgi:hypothetical protein